MWVSIYLETYSAVSMNDEIVQRFRFGMKRIKLYRFFKKRKTEFTEKQKANQSFTSFFPCKKYLTKYWHFMWKMLTLELQIFPFIFWHKSLQAYWGIVSLIAHLHWLWYMFASRAKITCWSPLEQSNVLARNFRRNIWRSGSTRYIPFAGQFMRSLLKLFWSILQLANMLQTRRRNVRNRGAQSQARAVSQHRIIVLNNELPCFVS